MTNILAQFAKISALLAQSTTNTTQLHIERQALVKATCPHAIGDIVDIPINDLFKAGCKLLITSIDYDYQTLAPKIPMHEFAWVVHGDVLDKDGKPSINSYSFHKTMADYLREMFAQINDKT